MNTTERTAHHPHNQHNGLQATALIYQRQTGRERVFLFWLLLSWLRSPLCPLEGLWHQSDRGWPRNVITHSAQV